MRFSPASCYSCSALFHLQKQFASLLNFIIFPFSLESLMHMHYSVFVDIFKLICGKNTLILKKKSSLASFTQDVNLVLTLFLSDLVRTDGLS